MTPTDATTPATQADRQLAAVIAGINGFAWTGQMYVEGLQDDDEIMRAIIEYRAALTDQSSADGMRSAFPESIGRLTLGEKLSSDHYCGGSHEMPNGHPVYWQRRGGEYPDDIEGFCLACAITNAESEAGWCKCSTQAALTPSAPAVPFGDVHEDMTDDEAEAYRAKYTPSALSGDAGENDGAPNEKRPLRNGR